MACENSFRRKSSCNFFLIIFLPKNFFFALGSTGLPVKNDSVPFVFTILSYMVVDCGDISDKLNVIGLSR